MSGPGYGCAFDGCDRAVRWLLTDLAHGHTISQCAEDFPVGMLALVAAELGVDPARMYDTVKRFVDREAAKAAKAAADPPPPPPAADDDDGQGVTAEKFFPGKTFGQDEEEETGIFHGFGEEAL